MSEGSKDETIVYQIRRSLLAVDATSHQLMVDDTIDTQSLVSKPSEQHFFGRTS